MFSCWYLCCIVYLFQLLPCFANATNVYYVPYASCATEKGCAFTDPIWNTSGSPVTGDSVFINSNISITIWATNIELSLGSTQMENVTFKLVDSSFTFGRLDFNSSSIVAEGSSINCEEAAGYDLILVNSSVSGYDCTVTNAQLTSSSISLQSATFDSIISEDSNIEIFYLCQIWNYGAVQDGQLTLGESPLEYIGGLALYNGTEVYITNTETWIPQQIYFWGTNALFSFTTTQSNISLTVGIVGSPFDAANNTLYLGENVIANFKEDLFEAYADHLLVGRNVTLNFYGFGGVRRIALEDDTSLPTINVYPTNQNEAILSIYPGILAANIVVNTGSAVELSHSNSTIVGSIMGNGSMYIDTNVCNFGCESLEINEVNVDSSYCNLEISVTSLFNVTLFTAYTNITVNASVAYFGGIKLEQNAKQIDILGDYSQTGGVIQFLPDPIWNEFPRIYVDGEITLTNVHFDGLLADENFMKQRVIVMRSLSKSVSTKGTMTELDAEWSQYYQARVVVEDGDVVWEITDFSTSHKIEDFFKHNYGYVIGAGVFLLLFIVTLVWVVKVVRRKKHSYVLVNQ